MPKDLPDPETEVLAETDNYLAWQLRNPMARPPTISN